MRIHVLGALALAGVMSAQPAAADILSDEDWQKIRVTLTGFAAANLCKEVKGCTILAVGAVEAANKGVELAIERYFDAEDQKFANRTGVTLHYPDGKIVKPQPKE